MTDNTQPEALRLAHIFDHPLPPEWPDMVAAAAELRRQHARIADLEAQLEAIGAGGVSPLTGQPQAMPDLSQLTERGAKVWAGVDAQELREGFTAADMATAESRGFRDGVASTAPPTAQAEGWRPIETAPKDGTWIELWRTPTDFGRMSPFVIARWDSTESMFVWPEFCDPFTKYGRDKADADIADGDCYGSADFTHWRPLSSPPTSAEGVEHG